MGVVSFSLVETVITEHINSPLLEARRFYNIMTPPNSELSRPGLVKS